MGACGNAVLIQHVIVVGIAVVNVFSGFFVHHHFIGNPILFAGPEVVQPDAGEFLRLVDARGLGILEVVPGVVEQAGIDISVVHDIRNGRGLHEGDVPRIGNGETLLVLVRILGGDEHYAVGGPGTVDGGRCRILQHGHAFYVVGVDEGGVSFHAVDEHQRAAAAADGGGAAHVVGGRPARFTVGEGDVQVGDAAHQHLCSAVRGTSFEDFGGHLVHGAGEVLFLHGAVAHHHHFVQEFGRHPQQDVHRFHSGTGDEGVIGIAERAHHHLGACRNGDGEVAVQVRNGSDGGAFHHHGGANHLFSRFRILHGTRQMHVLCPGGRRHGCQQEN